MGVTRSRYQLHQAMYPIVTGRDPEGFNYLPPVSGALNLYYPVITLLKLNLINLVNRQVQQWQRCRGGIPLTTRLKIGHPRQQDNQQ
jgi:hypothetical protein